MGTSLEEFKKKQRESSEGDPGNDSPEQSDSPEPEAESTGSEDAPEGESSGENDSSEDTGEDESASTFLGRVQESESVYESGEAYLVPMLTRQEGAETTWTGIVIPGVGYFYAPLNLQQSEHARHIRDHVTQSLVPYEVATGPVGEIYDEIGGRRAQIGQTQNYRQSELQIGTDNPGNIRLFTQQGGRLVPTNGQYNKHGQRLVNQAASAMKSGDYRKIAGYLRFIDTALGEEVRVDTDGFDPESPEESDPSGFHLEGVGPKGLVLERNVMGRESPEVQALEEEFEEDFETIQ